MSENSKIKFINLGFYLTISIAAAALLIWCASRAYHGFNPRPVMLLCIIIAISFILHMLRDARDPQCIKRALGLGTPRSDYNICYDYIRLFAVFAVILMHSLDAAMPFLSSELTEASLAAINSVPKNILYPAAACRILLYLGNTCFIMLTGALTLGRNADESFFSFYKKFLFKILLPFLIYFIFYMWQNGRFNPLSLKAIGSALYRIAACEVDADAPFLWLIYITISIYISVPFLRIIFNNISYRALTMLTAAILICTALRIYFNYSADKLPFFFGWTGIAIIGLWISKAETRAYDRLIWIAAALSVIKTASAANPYVYWRGYVEYYVHTAPLSIFMACGIFALALHWQGKKVHFLDPLIRLLSKNSYTILLLHWWSLHHILIATLSHRLSIDSPLDFALSVLLVIIIALVSGILLDQTVVFTARYICGRILNRVQGQHQASK